MVGMAGVFLALGCMRWVGVVDEELVWKYFGRSDGGTALATSSSFILADHPGRLRGIAIRYEIIPNAYQPNDGDEILR